MKNTVLSFVFIFLSSCLFATPPERPCDLELGALEEGESLPVELVTKEQIAAATLAYDQKKRKKRCVKALVTGAALAACASCAGVIFLVFTLVDTFHFNFESSEVLNTSLVKANETLTL